MKKMLGKALAVAGVVYLIGPLVGFASGVILTVVAMANAKDADVSEVLDKIKDMTNTNKDKKDDNVVDCSEKSEYDEGEAIPCQNSGESTAKSPE